LHCEREVPVSRWAAGRGSVEVNTILGRGLPFRDGHAADKTCFAGMVPSDTSRYRHDLWPPSRPVARTLSIFTVAKNAVRHNPRATWLQACSGQVLWWWCIRIPYSTDYRCDPWRQTAGIGPAARHVSVDTRMFRRSQQRRQLQQDGGVSVSLTWMLAGIVRRPNRLN